MIKKGRENMQPLSHTAQRLSLVVFSIPPQHHNSTYTSAQGGIVPICR